MYNRLEARREFLLEGSANRLKRLAEILETVHYLIAAGEAEVARKKLNELSWLVEWAILLEEADIQAELVELQQALAAWRYSALDEPARVIASEGAIAWADKLRWLSALLEATS